MSEVRKSSCNDSADDRGINTQLIHEFRGGATTEFVGLHGSLEECDDTSYCDVLLCQYGSRMSIGIESQFWLSPISIGGCTNI